MFTAKKGFATILIINHLLITLAPLFFSAPLYAENSKELSEQMDTLRSGLDSQLPTLSGDSEAESKESPFIAEEKLQSAAQSFWGVMASDNPTESGINKATNMASGLANNAIRDWLSHKGNARIELNTQGRSQGQVLLPVWESESNVLFSQLGVTNHSERTIYHAGAGLRNYISDDWMLGVNSFWDYDNTGNNSRASIGAEVWANNIKLAANGYFRLTDWHQSPLSAMRDYDERPANGFDIRGEAWHPSYPQLAANLKYEKYYGEGVILTGSTSPGNMTNSPEAWTVGLSYTPIPLITIDTEHTRGNDSDTRLKLSLNYRFGQSWKELIDRNLVKIGRSLLGQRYDFVDRNYDMVMQYRKQDLINLRMPASVTAEASSVLVLNAEIKSKYGLKTLQWNTQEIELAGGSVVKQSQTSLAITLPPYREDTHNSFVVSAVATDKHDNISSEAQTKIILTRSSNIVSLSASPASGLAASGAEVTVATATTTDQNGQPLAQKPVTFILSGSDGTCNLGGRSQCRAQALTNSQGIATVGVGHSVAGTQTLRAELDNGNSDNHALHFIADMASARIDSLIVNTQGGIANGVSQEELTVTVVDQNENPVPGAVITLSVTSNAQLSAANVQTDSHGKGTFNVSSHTAGAFKVTASTNNSSAQATVNFRADEETAGLVAGSLTVISDNARANNIDENQVQARVTDASGNLVPGIEVHFSAPTGVTILPAFAVTDSSGLASATVKTTLAGSAAVTARVNTNQQTVNVNFIGDVSTARVSIAPEVNNATANNIAQNRVVASVTDAWNNPLSNIAVEFSADNGAHISGLQVSDSQGQARAIITSLISGDSLVVVTLNNGQTGNTVVTFLADAGSAGLASGSLSVIADNAPANGIATNEVRALVQDSNGNPVPGITVNFSATNGASIITASAVTDNNGVANTAIMSTIAGESVITGVVNGSSDSASVTFIADMTTVQLSALSVIADNALANGTDENNVRATVTDAHGNPLSGMTVTFTANNGASVVYASAVTDVDGFASTGIVSTVAGSALIVATAEDSSESANVVFVADASTAELASGSLSVVVNGAIANGVAENVVQATVTDLHGNPVAGVSVTFSADNGAAVVPLSIATDAQGRVSASITSTMAGPSTVTAALNNTSSNVEVTFNPDAETATLPAGYLIVTTNYAVANGVATNAVQATVKDAYNNPVSGVTVDFTADNGASVALTSVITNAQGEASTTLTNTLAGVTLVTAVVNNHSDSTSVTFMPDATTAQLTEENLLLLTDGAMANGIAENSVEATVQDVNGNAVQGITVNFSADNHATITPASGITDQAGKVVATITNTRSGVSTVTASVNSVDVSVASHFIPGEVNAGMSSLAVSPLAIPADGVTETVLTFEAKDAFGNPVPNLTTLFFEANNVDVVISGPVEVSSGIYTGTLKSVNAGTANVTIKTTDAPAEVIRLQNVSIYPLGFNGKVTFRINRP